MKSPRKTKAKKALRKAKRKLGRPRKTAASGVMKSASEGASRAENWSSAKQEFAARVIKSGSAPAPEVKVVDLPPTGVLQVEFPPGVKPVVAVDSDRNVLEIVPVRRVEPRKKSWWESLFS